MTDYISRQAMIDRIKGTGYADQIKENFLFIARMLPSAPVREVVTCGECRFVGTDATCFRVCNREGMGLRPYHVHDDDFCSYAERKE